MPRAAHRRRMRGNSTRAAARRLRYSAPIAGQVLRVSTRRAKAWCSRARRCIEIGDPRALEVVVDVLSTDAVRDRAGRGGTHRALGRRRPAARARAPRRSPRRSPRAARSAWRSSACPCCSTWSKPPERWHRPRRRLPRRGAHPWPRSRMPSWCPRARCFATRAAGHLRDHARQGREDSASSRGPHARLGRGEARSRGRRAGRALPERPGHRRRGARATGSRATVSLRRLCGVRGALAACAASSRALCRSRAGTSIAWPYVCRHGGRMAAKKKTGTKKRRLKKAAAKKYVRHAQGLGPKDRKKKKTAGKKKAPARQKAPPRRARQEKAGKRYGAQRLKEGGSRAPRDEARCAQVRSLGPTGEDSQASDRDRTVRGPRGRRQGSAGGQEKERQKALTRAHAAALHAQFWEQPIVSA